jgi:hypothetical protein
MRYLARASIDYLREGTGDLCDQLGITLTKHGAYTMVEGPVFGLISFFTALARYYRLSLNEIKEKFT